MANFPRIRLPGFWTPGSVVAPGEFEALDEIRPKLINASEGSTHAPTSPVTIGGTGGLTVTGPLNATNAQVIDVPDGGVLTVKAGGEIVLDPADAPDPPALLTVNGLLRIGAGGNFEAASGAVASFLSGSSMAVKTASSLTIEGGGALDIFGQETVKSGGILSLDSGGTFTANVGSTVNLAGTTFRTGPLTINGDNASTGRRVGTLPASSGTVAPTKCIWVVPDSRGANLVYVLGTTPTPQDGQLLHFTGGNGPVSAHTVGFRLATDLLDRVTMPASALSWVTWRWDNGASQWKLARWHSNLVAGIIIL